MKNNTLQEILKKHKLWIDTDYAKGERANLRGADLQYADLQGANLRNADLQDANLQGANLQYANLRNAYLRNADLQGADLQYANLRNAYMRNADLQDANLQGANLRNADLQYANLNYPINCPETGGFIGYKKAVDDRIVKLLITDDAKRCSGTSRKCRCSRAQVLEITDISGNNHDDDNAISIHDKNFIYSVGKIVEVDNFDENRWNECSTGIHFFITRQEAVEYL